MMKGLVLERSWLVSLSRSRSKEKVEGSERWRICDQASGKIRWYNRGGANVNVCCSPSACPTRLPPA